MESEDSAADTALAVLHERNLRVPYYCEENVWRLLYRKSILEPNVRTWAVFISNSIKNVSMFQQLASENPAMSCCWDYHVIALAESTHNNNDIVVYDLDSRLPFPCPLPEYMQASFPYTWPTPYAPLFRVVEGAVFLQAFSSDRSHMFNATTGQWNAPPPLYATIQPGPPNLHHYLNCVEGPHHTAERWEASQHDQNVFGALYTGSELLAHFQSITTTTTTAL
jgi:protein N-terminal glutamine amidohydrolase